MGKISKAMKIIPDAMKRLAKITDDVGEASRNTTKALKRTGKTPSGTPSARTTPSGAKGSSSSPQVATGKPHLPDNVTDAQWNRARDTVRKKSDEIGGEPAVHGSRVSGTHRPDSDVDFAIRVDPKKFDEKIDERFGTPNPGSAKERTMQHAQETGKIQAGEAGMRQTRRQLAEELGMPVDISIIKKGGQFDNGPYIHL